MRGISILALSLSPLHLTLLIIMSATSLNSAKRVSFDDISTSVPRTVSPTLAAETAAISSASSLPHTITPFAIDQAQLIIKSYRLLHDQRQILSNLVSKEDSIPRSVRTKFILTTQKKFEKETAFKELQKRAEETVSAYHMAIKQVIIDKVKFEVKQLESELITSLVRGVYRLVDVLLVANRVPTHPGLTKTLTKTVFQSEDVQSVVPLPDDDYFDQIDLSDDILSALNSNPDGLRLMKLVKGVLIYPLKVFQDKVEENELLSSIRSMTTITTYDYITAATSMAVDTEPTVPPDSIRDEVRKQVQVATKKIETKLDSVLQSLKKDYEGPNPGASSKKNKLVKQNEKSKPNKQSNDSKKKLNISKTIDSTHSKKSGKVDVKAKELEKGNLQNVNSTFKKKKKTLPKNSTDKKIK